VRYALVLLMLINLLNNLDRIVINLLAEPIKRDLHLADWQVGLMTGLAFALCMGVLGLPIARWADRGRRPRIIVIALTLWSAFTVLCGVAQNFVQLCLCRMGVSFGEAGAAPPAHTLIVDYVPKERRASALGFFAIGVPLANMLGLPMAGLVADSHGWRVAFFVAGAPGLLFALIAALTLKETRADAHWANAAAADAISIRQTVSLLAANRTYWLITAAITIKAIVSFGQQAFIASFFLRSHGAEIGALAASIAIKPVGFMGLALGALAGVGGSLSVLFGGWISDRAAARDPRNIMVASAVSLVVQFPVFILALTVDSGALALCLLFVPYLMNSMQYPAIYATTQGIVPPRIRAMAAALQLMAASLIGLGTGPLLTGIVSDFLSKSVGLGEDQALRWSLISFSALALPCVALFLMTRKTIRGDMIS
jgi:MFS family permease